MTLRVLIVDDEPLARSRLREWLSVTGGIEWIGEAGSGQAAIDACAGSSIDIVLLDIRMPGMDGLDTARHLAALPRPPVVVFLTAYDDRAIDAFEAGAVDYLLKPVRRERLQQALERARRLVPAPSPEAPAQAQPAPRRQFVVRRSGSLLLVPVADVLCLRAEDKYVCLVCADGQPHLIEESLVAIEREFGERFLRVHRNCLVAADRLLGLVRNADGSERLRLRGLDEPLEVSRRNIAAVRHRLLQAG